MKTDKKNKANQYTLKEQYKQQTQRQKMENNFEVS